MPKQAAAIITGMIASPSSPSVRFTALDVPETTKPVKTMKTGQAKLAATSAKNGTDVHVVGCVEIGFDTRKAPRASPNVHWPIILYRATRPRVFFCTTLR